MQLFGGSGPGPGRVQGWYRQGLPAEPLELGQAVLEPLMVPEGAWDEGEGSRFLNGQPPVRRVKYKSIDINCGQKGLAYKTSGMSVHSQNCVLKLQP